MLRRRFRPAILALLVLAAGASACKKKEAPLPESGPSMPTPIVTRLPDKVTPIHQRPAARVVPPAGGVPSPVPTDPQ